MSYLERIRADDFRESDVEVFFVTHRTEFGSFIKEVGDFVAHSTRDQGETFKTAIGMFSQLAFFQTYQADKGPEAFEPIGECPWWLKSYLLHKVSSTSPHLFRKAFKLGAKEVRRKIQSWFPTDEPHPTRIEALEPFEAIEIVSFFLSQYKELRLMALIPFVPI